MLGGLVDEPVDRVVPKGDERGCCCCDGKGLDRLVKDGVRARYVDNVGDAALLLEGL